MRQTVHLIIIYTVLMLLSGCGNGKSVSQLPHRSDTPYQQDVILVIYATNPERASTLLDSVLLLDNISEYRNDDYAVILRPRATAADNQATAKSQTSTLNSQINLPHDYAAPYHAYEQQLKIQEKEAEAKRSHIVSLAVSAIALLAIAFAIYFFHQKRIVSEKNHALMRMINEQALPQKTLPQPLPVKERQPISNGTPGVDEPNSGMESGTMTSQARCEFSQDGDSTVEQYTSLPHREGAGEGQPGEGQLFFSIDAAIRTEHLYTNVALQRQDICDRFGISRHTLNDLLAEYAEGLSFPQYINGIRIQEALRLLHDEPSKTVATIAAEVGFTPSNLREQFKRKYGMTPAEFRQNL